MEIACARKPARALSDFKRTKGQDFQTLGEQAHVLWTDPRWPQCLYPCQIVAYKPDGLDVPSGHACVMYPDQSYDIHPIRDVLIQPRQLPAVLMQACSDLGQRIPETQVRAALQSWAPTLEDVTRLVHPCGIVVRMVNAESQLVPEAVMIARSDSGPAHTAGYVATSHLSTRHAIAQRPRFDVAGHLSCFELRSASASDGRVSPQPCTLAI
jgi:hypothetical protein